MTSQPTAETRPRTADAIRARNAALDAELRATVADLPAGRLHADPGGGEWTLAEQLGHIAEFPRFFAPDLIRQLREEHPTIGRTSDHPGRNAAVAAARGRTLPDLQAELDASLDRLAAALEEVRDEHLGRIARNRKYGPEPLSAFLDRYVIGHKAGHIKQLRETLERFGA